MLDYTITALKGYRKPGASKQAIQALIDILEDTTPKKRFLIRLLSQIDPDHAIFRLDYTPPVALTNIQSYPQPDFEVDARLVDLGVASKRRRGAKGLRMPVDSAIKESIDISNINTQIKTLTNRREEIQINKLCRQQIKEKTAAIRAQHHKKVAELTSSNLEV